MNKMISDKVITASEISFSFQDLLKIDYFQKYRIAYYQKLKYGD